MNHGEETYEERARVVFGLTRYCQREDESDRKKLNREICKLSLNMELLDRRNLGALNKNLIESGRKVWDFIAEHLFAVDLVNYNPDDPIAYEPSYMARPVDFVIEKQGINYWLQMKRLSILERENRQDSLYRIIKERLEQIPIPKFVSIMIKDNFEIIDIDPLLGEIADSASRDNINQHHFYSVDGQMRAEYSFALPNQARITSLTLGAGGDLDAVDITGLEADQIRGSLQKASLALNRECEATCINLIVMEADNKDNIDIGEACFGTEHYCTGRLGETRWDRDTGGFLLDSGYSSRITGVIAVRRKVHQPISNYEKTLFINPGFHSAIDSITRIIDIDHIIHFNDFIEQ